MKFKHALLESNTHQSDEQQNLLSAMQWQERFNEKSWVYVISCFCGIIAKQAVYNGELQPAQSCLSLQLRCSRRINCVKKVPVVVGSRQLNTVSTEAERNRQEFLTWPVWPSRKCRCGGKRWRGAAVGANWVRDAKKWRQCEIQPLMSRTLSFFRWHQSERNNWLSPLKFKFSHASNPPPLPFFLSFPTFLSPLFPTNVFTSLSLM